MSFLSQPILASARIRRVKLCKKPPWSLSGAYTVTINRRQAFSNSKSTSTNTQAPVQGDNSKPAYWTEFEASYTSRTSLPRFPASMILRENAGKQKLKAEGFLERIVVISKHMTFARLKTSGGEIQLLCHKNSAINQTLKTTPIGSAVRAVGVVHQKIAPKSSGKEDGTSVTQRGQSHGSNHANSSLDGHGDILAPEEMEIHLEEFHCLNSFTYPSAGSPNDRAIKHPPENRHLQIRFDDELAARLRFRSEVMKTIRHELGDFHEIETPILFKSTPEGAREFLVPTRRKGHAYALPQSPQQYKQILMASGITNYFQFARCFRDEDLRADRQPEFTQVDLEMSWASGHKVMLQIEKLILSIYERFSSSPILSEKIFGAKADDSGSLKFPKISYGNAMSWYGSDKPDLRIEGKIVDITHIVSPELQKMMTALENPSIDAWRFRTGMSPKEVRGFLQDFLDSADAAPFRENSDGGPGVCVFDGRAPLEGLQIFGHEGAGKVAELWAQREGELEDGDLIILQARESGPFYGGSTMLGKLRLALHKAAVAEGIVDQKSGHHYLWVTDFPMFTPDNGIDPGQGGSAGFSATHHPFTAPNSGTDLELLRTDPLSAKADHYDLVVNGVELGGGSRRIHNAEVQKYVMSDILKMSEERMNDFSHLFDALSSGCPPHAGFAIGFDRLIAVLTGRESVKDVIAFPKSSKGEDMMVRSPSRMTDKELETYHLQLINDEMKVRK